MERTEFSYPLLLDKDRKLYRQLGLRRSAAIWNVSTLVGYAEEKIAKVSGVPAYAGDDLHVMGGDYITDSRGKVVYAYSSKTQRDRPNVSDLTKFLTEQSTL